MNGSLANAADTNPFERTDHDRSAIWEMLMRRDFEAFVTGNWSMIVGDFWPETFCGVDARKDANPDNWRITYPSLDSYRDEWLRQVREFASIELKGTTVRDFLYASCRLTDIEIAGERALAHKKFNGQAIASSGGEVVLRFQSLYQLARSDKRWVITGFVGYLPIHMIASNQVGSSTTPW